MHRLIVNHDEKEELVLVATFKRESFLVFQNEALLYVDCIRIFRLLINYELLYKMKYTLPGAYKCLLYIKIH